MEQMQVGNKKVNVGTVRQWAKYNQQALDGVSKKYGITAEEINTAIANLPVKEKEFGGKRLDDLVTRINGHNHTMEFVAVLNGIRTGAIDLTKPEAAEFVKQKVDAYYNEVDSVSGERGAYIPLVMLPKDVTDQRLLTVYCATWEGERFQYMFRFAPNAKKAKVQEMLKDRPAIKLFSRALSADVLEKKPELANLNVSGGIFVDNGPSITAPKPEAKPKHKK